MINAKVFADRRMNRRTGGQPKKLYAPNLLILGKKVKDTLHAILSMNQVINFLA
jgi:hypothetical protein